MCCGDGGVGSRGGCAGDGCVGDGCKHTHTCSKG